MQNNKVTSTILICCELCVILATILATFWQKVQWRAFIEGGVLENIWYLMMKIFEFSTNLQHA